MYLSSAVSYLLFTDPSFDPSTLWGFEAQMFVSLLFTCHFSSYCYRWNQHVQCRMFKQIPHKIGLQIVQITHINHCSITPSSGLDCN